MTGKFLVVNTVF